MNSFFTMLKT
ncbi:hypothetical protein L195_g062400, partial [Trifolium pratense]